MFTVTDNTTLVTTSTNGSPYANELADLQVPVIGITEEYVNLTGHNLVIVKNEIIRQRVRKTHRHREQRKDEKPPVAHAGRSPRLRLYLAM